MKKAKPTKDERQRKRESETQFVAERIAEYTADPERFARQSLAEVKSALAACPKLTGRRD